MLDEAIAGLNREKEVMKSEIDTREAEHTANLEKIDHRIKLEMDKLESLHLEIRAEHKRLGSLTGKADAPWGTPANRSKSLPCTVTGGCPPAEGFSVSH